MNTTLRQRLIDAYVANPDGRTKAHKAAVRNAYESTIHELTTQLGQCTETIQRKTREINRLRMKVSDDDLSELTEDTTCLICADEMDGKVTLKCGHIMCPGCFARHSRVNNTCPFCRDEFAPKVKLPAKLPWKASTQWQTTGLIIRAILVISPTTCQETGKDLTKTLPPRKVILSGW